MLIQRVVASSTIDYKENYHMNQLISRLLSGLVTGAVIGTAVLVPVKVAAQSASGVKVTTESQLKGETNKWSANNTAKPGDTLTYIISYQNTSTTTHKQVKVSSALPSDAQLVANTTKVYNSGSPDGNVANNNDVAGNGVVIGDYAPGANGYVTFQVTLPAADKLKCGNNELRNTGTVRVTGLDDSKSAAVTTVRRECAATPQATPTPPPAQTTTPTPTPPAPAPAATPAPAAPAAEGKLPETGAGSIIGLFAAATAAGYGFHRLVLRRKLV